MRTVRELLLVRGVTPKLLFGDKAKGTEDLNKSSFSGRPDRGWFPYLTAYSCEKNVNADGEKRLNIKTADANTIAQRLSLEKWAAESIVKARGNNKINHLVDLLDVQKDTSNHRTSETEADINTRSDSEKNQPVTKDIFKRIIDDITLKDDETFIGRININTASSTILKTLPGIDDDLTNAILRAREGNRQGFSTIADLLDLSDMKKEKFAGLEDFITVRSRVFRVKSTGSAASGLAVATIECVVDRNTELPMVVYWLESSP
jgi:DNA uptake protein ComE-like DNA-binding protein